ncbi:wax ester/triacylglycerol synthase domain-containing protein [Saccharothrix xinjiangensis]|uniref:diacylglycerol O-acyltransferase n=1 Tax=Saccharothrix xinjiangensis TaxID=204798 RepID=A0ABV9Y081_9PSEU
MLEQDQGEAVERPATEWMSGLDALLWRAQQTPALHAPMTFVFLLDRAPDHEEFLAEHARFPQLVPRLGQHVLDGPLGLGVPRWAPDPRFDLANHVRRVRLPDAAGVGGLLELAQRLAYSPFDRRHPLWEAVLVDRVDERRAGYVIRLHHSIADGVNVVRLAMLLFGADPGARRAAGDAMRSGHASFLAEAGGKLAGEVAGAARHPVRTALRVGKVTRSLLDLGARLNLPGSPALRHRGGSWRFLTSEVPLSTLREASRRVGATVNDAMVTAVLGAVRRYHEHLGERADRLTVSVLLGGRGGQSAGSGNNMSLAPIDAPVGETDPIRRMRLVGDLVNGARGEQSGTSPVGLVGLTGFLPGAVTAPVLKTLSTRVDVLVSNVRGPAELRLAGCRVEGVFPFGPTMATAVNVSTTSYLGTCYVGTTVDTAAVRDPDLFATCLREGFAEVTSDVGAAPGAG